MYIVSQTAMKTSRCLKKEKSGMPRQENLLVLDDTEYSSAGTKIMLVCLSADIICSEKLTDT